MPEKTKSLFFVAKNKLMVNELTGRAGTVYKDCCYWKLPLWLAFASQGRHQTNPWEAVVVRHFIHGAATICKLSFGASLENNPSGLLQWLHLSSLCLRIRLAILSCQGSVSICKLLPRKQQFVGVFLHFPLLNWNIG